MKVFVTGGAGYIGSHTAVELLKAGHDVVLYDNLCNADARVVGRIEKIAGSAPVFVEGDVRDRAKVEESLRAHRCDAVIHFAGLKAVGESVEKPLDYYDNNVGGTLSILMGMKKVGVPFIVFSSSATVYGAPQYLPLDEKHPLSTTNPYGQTKLVAEGMITDFLATAPAHKAALLRYFNPVGAHESGLIGENPRGIPNNLFPYVSQVALGQREALNVWGNDYDTPDGTGVRDYVHVVDLAIGHVKALDYMAEKHESLTVNLGTGQGYSVLDIVKAYEASSGQKIPYVIAPRRPGDIATCYADASLAETLLGWRAHCDLAQMCRDSWNWQSQNPNGYE
ncbi:MAG: UDP-glucose 4-epimerase GalE [Alphaproteobacteria bacterium]|jgi:UDP-glucose 4-epimerase|nr:UDP-glucose 4-epimerase GalE [Alphaproteobacteria bacterium]